VTSFVGNDFFFFFLTGEVCKVQWRDAEEILWATQ